MSSVSHRNNHEYFGIIVQSRLLQCRKIAISDRDQGILAAVDVLKQLGATDDFLCPGFSGFLEEVRFG